MPQADSNSTTDSTRESDKWDDCYNSILDDILVSRSIAQVCSLAVVGLPDEFNPEAAHQALCHAYKLMHNAEFTLGRMYDLWRRQSGELPQ